MYQFSAAFGEKFISLLYGLKNRCTVIDWQLVCSLYWERGKCSNCNDIIIDRPKGGGGGGGGGVSRSP